MEGLRLLDQGVRRGLRALLVSSLVAALIGCGGADRVGSPDAVERSSTPEDADARKSALAAVPGVNPIDAAHQLMDFGQAQFPAFFPGMPADQAAGDIVYRFYPLSGSYLAVVNWEVYVFGGPFGSSIQHVGALTDFISPRASDGAAPCSSTTLTWSGGERICTAAVVRTRSGHALNVSASNGPAGSARFACLNGTWGSPADTICLGLGVDSRSVTTMPIGSRLSVAGQWHEIPTRPDERLVGSFWGAVRIGPDQLESLVLGGWAFANDQDAQVTPNRVALLKQQPNGTMVEAGSEVLGDTMTNGLGSVIVHDFNADGFDDIVLLAHNEKPFVGASSTAYLSRADGHFEKQTLSDQIMAHDAKLLTLGGSKKIVAASFGGRDSSGRPLLGGNPVYSWNGHAFEADTTMLLVGFSVLAANFAGDGTDWIIAGGWSRPAPVQTEPWRNVAFRYNGLATTSNQSPIRLPEPYFNNKPEYANLASFGDPLSKTHTSRLWLTDFNQDGRPDIIGGEELWDPILGLQRSALQLMTNQGHMVFKDQTDELAPEYDKLSFSIDYSIRLIDIDGSGIDSIFTVGAKWMPHLDKHNGNHLLVNDGTGRFYAVLHSEFSGLTPQIRDFASASVRARRSDAFINPTTHPPMYPYRVRDGTINYVALLYGNFGYGLFVNVPLGINVTTDFRRNLLIPTRNGSRNIRTFAGDDVIHRSVADPDCKIDGGLGTNTVVYPGRRTEWIISRDGTRLTVRPANTVGGIDTLVRIRYAKFDDVTVDLNQED